MFIETVLKIKGEAPLGATCRWGKKLIVNNLVPSERKLNLSLET